MIGICPLTFWQLTPGELSIMIHAYNERKKHEHDEQLVVAYLTAYWHRVKRMPSINDVISKKPVKNDVQQTPEEMLEEIKRLNIALGGTVY